LPDGQAWYAYYVQEHTTTNLTPEQIHALGLGEVKRILGEMDHVRQQVGFKGDLCIEREAGSQRVADIGAARAMVETIPS